MAYIYSCCSQLFQSHTGYSLSCRASQFVFAQLAGTWLQVTDKEVFDAITCSTAAQSDGGHASFVADRAEVAIRTAAKMGCASQQEALAYLGKHFRVVLPHVLEDAGDIEVCDGFCLMLHLQPNFLHRCL
jgi:hypothetical protein